MARVEYYVAPHGNEWKIKYDGKDYPYRTKAEAIRAAIDAAHKSGQQGHDAQVHVQRADGKFQTEWTYGHDPYPPKG